MKKLLLVILCVSIISPSFAMADKGSGSGRDKDKKENKVEDDSHRSSNHTAATTSPSTVAAVTVAPVVFSSTEGNPLRLSGKIEDNRNEVKLRYFFCNSTTPPTLVAINERLIKGNKSRWPSEVRGCVKLSGGFAKKLQRMMVTTTSTSTPPVITDTTAPVISLLSVSAIAPTTATISWTTNENADGEVYFGTNNPVKSGIFRKVESKVLSTTHSFTITGLTASTTYFYLVESRDGQKNKVESAQGSFVTPAAPVADTVAPTITGVTTNPVASTTATVSWTTNELANGKLWYGTSTPLTLSVNSLTPSLAHSFSLTGLTASTTYSLLLESADAANNVATTTASVTTTN